MTNDDKKIRTDEINKMIGEFCVRYLNDEFKGYAQTLCEKIGRKRILSITKGKKEIWAAAIIYVIARLNFLFDKENEYFITADTICDFFGTKKSTSSNKATQIEKSCDIRIGEPELCAFDAALRAVQARGLDLDAIGRDEFPLHDIADSVRTWHEQIQEGRGLLVLRGFPVVASLVFES